jgi:hypothetical protein
MNQNLMTAAKLPDTRRTRSQWSPKLPEVLAAAVREAGQNYDAARRAFNELPALIASAKRRHGRPRLSELQR